MIRKTMLAALMATALIPAAAGSRPVHVEPAAPTVSLVHGAFADGSSWSKVIPRLEARGAPALAVQNPLTSLQDDVAATRRAIAAAPGKVVLVGMLSHPGEVADVILEAAGAKSAAPLPAKAGG
ncbi:hypothetical protein JRI60_14255 [Archangium violaceum]|uniref:hypothetical protein n=1 Tax=Archangium violaceum TaxID=83451 RepID=UPI00194E1321|nr:hypothetical protein [Archangium violaceum]QRO00088.1 hypothetical protein JRI60_14255 [Archangium violaceum]